MTVKETCQSYKWSHLRNRGSKIQNILPTRDLVKIGTQFFSGSSFVRLTY